MRKAKAKKAGKKGVGGDDTSKKEEAPAAAATSAEPGTPTSSTAGEGVAEGGKEERDKGEDVSEVQEEKTEQAPEEQPAEEAPAEAEEEPVPAPVTKTPSLAQQSKARSRSFRQGSISITTGSTPLSPGGLISPVVEGGETAPDIYRKQAQRIEELEKENKALAKEVRDVEKRWQRAEEELADLRERDLGDEGEVARLVSTCSTTHILDLKGDKVLTMSRKRRLRLCRGRTPSCRLRSAGLGREQAVGMGLHRPCRWQARLLRQRPSWKPNFAANQRQLRRWSSRCRVCAHKLSGYRSRRQHLLSRSLLSKRNSPVRRRQPVLPRERSMT